MDALGVLVDTGDTAGALIDVRWQSAAFEAGLVPGMTYPPVYVTQATREVMDEA